MVFSEEIPSAGLTAEMYGQRIAEVVPHETGHLLGMTHDADNGSGPLAGVAFDPKVHVAIGTDAADDAMDGNVTINGEQYTVHPLIVAALTTQRPFYNAGTVAGDGFPDVLMGQFAIHLIEHATWLTRVLDMAWKAQALDSGFDEPNERLQILAWSYGFLTHLAGDHWAHTDSTLTVDGPLVNETSSGDEKIVVRVAKTMPITLTASAADNTFTRSDPGGSFVADGFVPEMRFDALGMDANYKTYIVKTVTPTVLTVVGGISGGAGEVSELVDAAGVANVQLVAIGQRGPGLDNLFKLRDALFGKAVDKGPRGNANELATLASQAIENLVNGNSIDGLKDDLFRAYLYNWVNEIDEGVRHWGEVDLALHRQGGRGPGYIGRGIRIGLA